MFSLQVPVVSAAPPRRGLGSTALLIRHSRSAGLVHTAGKNRLRACRQPNVRCKCVSQHSVSVSFWAYQAEFGDYEPDQPRPLDYVTQWTFAPNQNKEMEEKILELHKSHRSDEMLFAINASTSILPETFKFFITPLYFPGG